MPRKPKGIMAADMYNIDCKYPGMVLAEAVASGCPKVAINIWEETPEVIAISSRNPNKVAL